MISFLCKKPQKGIQMDGKRPQETTMSVPHNFFSKLVFSEFKSRAVLVVPVQSVTSKKNNYLESL